MLLYVCTPINTSPNPTPMASNSNHHLPSLPLRNCTAIVTGGSRGIGRAIALHLSSLGANLVIAYASNSTAASLVASSITASSSGSAAVVVKANVSDPDVVKSMFDAAESAFGGPAHILVNCAGVVVPKTPTLSQTPVEDWDLVFNVNARGTFLCCREAANRLAPGGRIINFSSSMNVKPLPGFGASTAAKAAVETMTRFLAKELKGTGITVNCVAPGAIETEIFRELGDDAALRRAVEECPMGRLGRVADVAPVVGFLVGEGGGWVNGQVIRVNGGYA